MFGAVEGVGSAGGLSIAGAAGEGVLLAGLAWGPVSEGVNGLISFLSKLVIRERFLQRI